MIKNLFIATSNAGKLEELTALLRLPGLSLVTPRTASIELEVEESGSTYLENALLKANAYCQASGLACLGDDTGLEVEALGGLPGLRSARFTGDANASDHERRQLLLSRLADHPRPWKARFVCWVVLALPNGERHSAAGMCEGEIIPQERGTNGFGYDSIFLFTHIGKTMAELTLVEKNRLSHRAKAVQAMLPNLEQRS